MTTTRKKVKIIGTKEFYDKETGEISTFNVIDIEERDANFHKIWLFNVINSINLIGNQKIKFAFWLIDNMDTENKICMTMRQMAEKSSLSLDTVRRTLKILQDNDFIIRKNIGVYQVNPDVIWKGGKNERLRILLDYHNE